MIGSQRYFNSNGLSLKDLVVIRVIENELNTLMQIRNRCSFPTFELCKLSTAQIYSFFPPKHGKKETCSAKEMKRLFGYD
jgi:hypothetical protein